MEDEMVEMTLLQQKWTTLSNVNTTEPIAAIEENIDAKGNKLQQQNIVGLLNNENTTDKYFMQGSASWLQFPISLYDVTKINFTLSWQNLSCPDTPQYDLICSPQGGFALVFQQESAKSIGNYQNNYGEGLGYDGISGILAIEFDTKSNVNKNDPANSPYHISVQKRNPYTQLLSSNHLHSISFQPNPINFVNSLLQGFNSNINVSVGIIGNQQTSELIIIIELNGIRQIYVETTFAQIGLDPQRAYYIGFTAAQNLDKSVPTGYLNINKFRLFKSRPRFVEGQVQYLNDTAGKQNMEVRTHFLNLCKQKTTILTYPSSSIENWLSNSEDKDIVGIVFENTEDGIMIFSCTLQNLLKTAFYIPDQMYITTDLTFYMGCTSTLQKEIRVAFYYNQETVQNLTAIDYKRLTASGVFSTIVVENSDLITGFLSVKGYVNNQYQFNAYAFDSQLNPINVTVNSLNLTVTSQFLKKDDTDYSNNVTLVCDKLSSTNAPTSDKSAFSTQFTCSFIPIINGTYYINSPYLPSGRSFKIDVLPSNLVQKFLSTEYSYASVMGDFEIDSGAEAQFFVDLKDNYNNSYSIATANSAIDAGTDICTFANSYYVIDGLKYFFLFTDSYPYLRTIIQKSGVANFHILVTCKSANFELYCYRCQKLIRPLKIYYYSLLTMPAYPSTFTVPVDTQVVLTQSQNLVLDLAFYDRFDNLVQVDKSVQDYQTALTYGNNTINFQAVQMPGKIHFYLSDTDNALVKKLKPRANYYYVSMNNPTSDQCNSTNKNYMPLLIASQDRMAPIEVVQDNDNATLDKNASVVYWDKLVPAGNVGRFAFILRNKNGLQLNSFVSLDLISINFYDMAQKPITKDFCTSIISLGLYEGEYYGWFNCIQPQLISMSILVSGKTINQEGLPISIVSNNIYKPDDTFYALNGKTFMIGSGVLDFNFKLLDKNSQPVDSVLINRDNPLLGSVTYNLTRVDSGASTKSGTIPMKQNGMCRISFENLMIGANRLYLNLPNNKTYIDFIVTSNSTELSPTYSSAFRQTGVNTLVIIGNYITVYIQAMNIHNSTMKTSKDAAYLLAQLRVQVTSEEGIIFPLNITGVTNDTTDGSGYLFEYRTITPVTRKGTYFTDIFFNATGKSMYVNNGTFFVDESFWVQDSELYILKGIDVKEYKMSQFSADASKNNVTFKMQHYNAKYDGNLRFKLYFRTRNFYEIIDNVDLSSHKFTAYLAYTSETSAKVSEFAPIPNITMNVETVNSDYLLIVPANYSDITNIEGLQEGLYMIVLYDTTGGTTYILKWLFSMFAQGNAIDNGNLRIYTPSSINITAGEPFTFTCDVSSRKNDSSLNTVSSFFTDLSDIDIQSTLNGNTFYITVYTEKAGSATLLLQGSHPAFSKAIREISFQVNANDLNSIQLVGVNKINNRTYQVGTFVVILFDLRDRYGNNILSNSLTRPIKNKAASLIQVSHQDRLPLQQFVDYNSSAITLTFTSNYVGNVSIASSLYQSTNKTIVITFNTTLPPSYKTTQSMMNATRVKTGEILSIQISLKDEFGNKLSNYTVKSTQFIVNLVPDNQCNATTVSMNYSSQLGDLVYYSGSINRICSYNAVVYYFSPTEGIQVLPCANCYLQVEAGPEDIKRLELLDGRDMPITLRNMQSLHFRKYDQNPVVIMTFRDQYDNLVPLPVASLTYDYQFDLVLTTVDTVNKIVKWNSYLSFHYLSLCQGGVQNGCFELLPATRLRIIQKNKTTGSEIQRVFFPISIIENYGLQYQADSVNPISASYSYLRILNQDMIDGLGYDLPVLQDKCISGKTYPIIGRIDVRSQYGFRRFENFDSLINRISIVIDELDRSQYDVKYYGGSTNGTVLFTLFIQDDFFFDTKIISAKLYLDGTLFSNRQINVQCRRRSNYLKYVISSQTYQGITTLEQTVVKAGEPITIWMTNQDSNGARFLPYDSKVALFNNVSGVLNSTYTVVEDLDKNIISISFPGLTSPGTYYLLGHSMSQTYKLQVKANNISSEYSFANCDSFNISAGDTSVNIVPYDKYGNSISIANNEITNDILKNIKINVYYSKYNVLRQDRWRVVTQSTLQSVNNSIHYTIKITEKGIYQYRAIINGRIVPCQNCFVRVTQGTTISLQNSLVTDLSQNYYQSAFGTGLFRVVIKSQYLYMKLILKDTNGNAFLSEDALPTQNIAGKLSLNIPFNVTRLLPNAAGCQIYKITMISSQVSIFTSAAVNTYNLDLSLTGQTTLSTPVYLRNANPSYPTTSSSTQYSYRKLRTEYSMIAGKLRPLAFDMVDDSGIMISTYQTIIFTYQINNKDNIQYSLGNIIMGQYKGIYERLIRIDTSLDNTTALFHRDDILISISNTSYKASGEYIYTVVYPGGLSSIQYDNLNQKMMPLDSQGNPIDINYDNKFQSYIVQQRTTLPLQRLANYQLQLNYLTKKLDVSLDYTSYTQLSQFSIQDSLFQYTYNAYTQYTPSSQGVVIDKSYFTLNSSQLLTNETVQIKVALVDYMGNSLNSQLTQSDLKTIKVFVVLPNQQDIQILNFTTNDLTINYSVKKSGFSFIYVTYGGLRVKVREGFSNKWFIADPNFSIKTPNNSTFTFSIAQIQKFKIAYPEQINNTEYLNFMKTQPFFLLLRICDALGNTFEDTSIYTQYGIGDLGLQTRIEGLGITEKISTQINYNVIRIMIDNSTQREFYTRLVPTVPTNNMKTSSYVVKFNSPGLDKTFDVQDIFLQISSNSAVENYLASNGYSSNNKTLSSLIQSAAFDDPAIAAVKTRQYQRAIHIIQVLNMDNKTYSAEIIKSLALTQSVENTKIKIIVFPLMNDGFYRIQFYSEQIFDMVPNNMKVQIKTSQTYPDSAFYTPIQLYVFPPAPPNYQNLMTNLTWLQSGKSAYQVYQKIQVNLTLMYNGTIYNNDVKSAGKIQIYKRNTLQNINVQLINNNIYQFYLTIDEPNRYSLSIFYIDTNGALYSIMAPDILIFTVKPLDQLQAEYVQSRLSQSESFKWWKLPAHELPVQYQLQLKSSSSLQAVDITQVKLQFIPNLSNNNEYIIGSDLRALVLVVDKTTGRCLVKSDYSYINDLDIQIKKYDPLTKQPSNSTLASNKILLVKQDVSVSQSNCAYFVSVSMQSNPQISEEGSYILLGTFLNKVTANFTFTAKVAGIDFTQTQVGWYPMNSNPENKFIAEFKANDQFNYLVYFRDVKGNYVSEKVSYVKIQVKFEGQNLVEPDDYNYLSRYDDRYNGYLITIQFTKPGSFQPQYYFNLQKANVVIKNGPALFFVREPQCKSIQILSSGEQVLKFYQEIVFVFMCIDQRGLLINNNIEQLDAKAVFVNTNMSNYETYTQVQSNSEGKYTVQYKFSIQGSYYLKIYFNQLLAYEDQKKVYQVTSDICRNPISGEVMFRCPGNSNICANNPQECDYTNSTVCTDLKLPFMCTLSTSSLCVANMQKDCCTSLNTKGKEDFKWCPHLNKCINTTITACCSLNSSTPIFCKSSNTCVKKRSECCDNYQYTVTDSNGTNKLMNMTKCSYEDKCVPSNTNQYCFTPFARSCQEFFNDQYSYQCMNDGKCKRNSTECPSPRVCPPGYTQCPDYSCIPGLNSFNECPSLSQCNRTLPNNAIVNYIRCADGSCARQFEDCPSQVSCLISGLVVCPDGSCRNSEFECTQPIYCSADTPIRCPGQANMCAKSQNECPLPSVKTCPGTQMLCVNGECSDSCDKVITYNSSTTSASVVLKSLHHNCSAIAMIQCPNFECRKSYEECSNPLYCPLPTLYTFSPQPVICPSAQICAFEQSECRLSHCQRPFNGIGSSYSSLSTSNSVSDKSSQLLTCYDGRCHQAFQYKQNACFTPISCSINYFKSGGFGEFCVESTSLANQLMSLAIILNANVCPTNQFKCVTGECRNSADDCPSQITCPSQFPIHCRDGQCVKSKSLCLEVDIAVEKNLQKCLSLGMLLCTSDLITCSDSLNKCPSRSSCPIGMIKCWNGICIDPMKESCQNPQSDLNINYLSTCQDQSVATFYCFADGSCRKSLEDCPTISTCPSERPVKCMDNSCRLSILNCPTILSCPTGFKYCPGEGNCIQDYQMCGSVSTCPPNKPYKCEDQQCVANLASCEQESHQLSIYGKTCIEQSTNYLCSNMQLLCSTNITACPASNSCKDNMNVKSYDTDECVKSRDDLPLSTEYNIATLNDEIQLLKALQSMNINISQFSTLRNASLQCPLSIPFKCPSGFCVKTKSHCPLNQILNADLEYCQKVNPGFYQVPCGDGSCVKSYDLCMPLYDCLLNVDSQQFYKCNDGTCKSSLSQCNNSMDSICPSHAPFMCVNRMCAPSFAECIRNDNGCIEGMPYRCPYSGQCMKNSSQCQPTFSIQQRTFVVPTNTTVSTKISLLQSYGLLTNLCQTQNKFLCKLNNGQMRCVNSLSECIYNDNNCPVDAPIRCGNACLSKASDCSNDTCKGFEDRCPSTQCMTSSYFTSCKTMNGCPSSTPFRCSSQGSEICMQLPYTSNPLLYNISCSSVKVNSTIDVLLNECASSDTPYSCADGSCVRNINECHTCIYYCTRINKCVRSIEECQLLRSRSLEQQLELNQLCPLSSPTRCIVSGKCVKQEQECMSENSMSFRSQFNYTFDGPLVSEKCPYQLPIQCQDGTCVGKYDDCFQYIKDNHSVSFASPIEWGSNQQEQQQSQNISSCQVYCSDGSCRDRVENCPLIEGCYDPQKPYRCKSGLCSSDQSQCVQLFGTIENEDSKNTITQTCQIIGQKGLGYHRCEDGVCRPVIVDPVTNATSYKCLPYMGCPLDKPFHCSSGDCVTDATACAGTSQCPYNKPFRCKNFECVAQISDCTRPYHTYHALQIDRTLNPYEENNINFAFSRDGQAIGKVKIISNALLSQDNSDFNTSLDILQRLQVYPVPDSILDTVSNQIPSPRIDYMSRIYPVPNLSLNRSNTLLTPVVKLESHNGAIKYLHQSSISFKLDNASIPSVINLKNDTCLGKIIDLDKGNPSWQCQSRNFSINEDGFLQFSIFELGIYAVIVNPDPDIGDQIICGFICQNHTALLILELIMITFVAFLFYCLFICCQTKKVVKESEKKHLQVEPNNENRFSSPYHGSMYNPPRKATQASYLPINATLCDETFSASRRFSPAESNEYNEPESPNAPYQHIQTLTQQNQKMEKQIAILKSQLEEHYDKEFKYMSLLKATQENYKVMSAQIALNQDLSVSASAKTGSKSRSKRPKRVKNLFDESDIDFDPLKQFTSNVEPIHNQSMETYDMFPGQTSISILKNNNIMDQSLLSVQENRNMLIVEQDKDFIEKNYRSEVNTNSENMAKLQQQDALLIEEEQEENESDDAHNNEDQQSEEEKTGDEERKERFHRIRLFNEEDNDETSMASEKHGMQTPRQAQSVMSLPFHDQEHSKGHIDDTDSQSVLAVRRTFFAVNPNAQQLNSSEVPIVTDTAAYNMPFANQGITGSITGRIINLPKQDQSQTNRELTAEKGHSKNSSSTQSMISKGVLDISKKKKDSANKKTKNYK